MYTFPSLNSLWKSVIDIQLKWKYLQVATLSPCGTRDKYFSRDTSCVGERKTILPQVFFLFLTLSLPPTNSNTF